MQVTITPKYVNEPKPGKKNWSIKDQGDVYYSIPPDMAPSFKVGQPVTVDYQSKDFGGRSINMVERVYAAQAPMQQAPLPPQVLANLANGSPAPQVRNGDPRSEDIFVAGVVNNAIAYQSHPVDGRSLSVLVQAARWAYRHGEPATNDEFGDAPF
jgi:hypothetical protein